MLHKINYLLVTRSVLEVTVILVKTNLHYIVLVYLFLYFMLRLCLDFETTRLLATVKQEERLWVFKYRIYARLHYKNLGSYKELLDLIEAKAWRINELIILRIHLAEIIEDVIEGLAIDILPPFSSRRHNHVEKI